MRIGVEWRKALGGGRAFAQGRECLELDSVIRRMASLLW